MSFLKLAPLILVKLLPKGAFGPWVLDEDRQGRAALAADVTLVLSVVAGGSSRPSSWATCCPRLRPPARRSSSRDA